MIEDALYDLDRYESLEHEINDRLAQLIFCTQADCDYRFTVCAAARASDYARLAHKIFLTHPELKGTDNEC